MSEERREVEEGMRALAAWAVGVSFEDLPADVARRAALVIADDMAAMVAARDEPELRGLHDSLLAQSGPAEATVFRGGRPRADRASAAVANGTAANWCELDEGYRKVTCHAGLYSVPAILAEAEAEGLTVEEVLRAVTVAYEIGGRFARTWQFPRVTVHPHSAWSTVGAAAGAGLARGLSEAEFLDALTSASTLTMASPFNHAMKGAMIENAWAGVAAWAGFRCVDWARCGIGGLADSPYDVFADNLGAGTHAGELTENLGGDWAVSEGYHKIFSCCQYAHSTVEATLSNVVSLPAGKGPENIEKVEVETHRMGMKLDNRAPETTLAARFSIPQIVAATCVFGHAGADAFAAPTLHMPEIRRIRERTEMRLFEPEMPPPHDRPARVTITLDDGQTVSDQCLSAQGGPDHPFPPEVILEKGATITAGVYPDFAPVLASLYALDASVLERRWDDLVGEMVGGTPA
jgi:2-methylcitrate dehydratase PrpD